MKTSNKLILTAVIIILVSMIAYDIALRAEYRKGEYKNRFYGLENLNLNGFTTIDNRAANLISIEVEKGNKSEVWIEKNWKEHLKILKNGTTLVIEFAGNSVNKSYAYQNNLTIICPLLEEVITSSVENSKLLESDDSEGTTTLKGFNLQNLILNIGKKSALMLEKNKISSLQAVVGSDLTENARLTIASDNQIKLATVKVPGKNFLTIENPIITATNFTVSDSATVSTSGRFLKHFQKQDQR